MFVLAVFHYHNATIPSYNGFLIMLFFTATTETLFLLWFDFLIPILLQAIIVQKECLNVVEHLVLLSNFSLKLNYYRLIYLL